MKRYSIIKLSLSAALLSAIMVSCTKKLDLVPTNDVTSELVYSTAAGYKQSLAKIYGAWALTGNQGPAGAPDVFFPGSDEGANSDFYRTFWKAQELSTDEAVIAWGDPGVQDFHNMNWTSGNQFLTGAYYKALYQITLVNEFLRQATDDKLSKRNITGVDADVIRKYRAEVRFFKSVSILGINGFVWQPAFCN